MGASGPRIAIDAMGGDTGPELVARKFQQGTSASNGGIEHIEPAQIAQVREIGLRHAGHHCLDNGVVVGQGDFVTDARRLEAREPGKIEQGVIGGKLGVETACRRAADRDSRGADTLRATLGHARIYEGQYPGAKLSSLLEGLRRGLSAQKHGRIDPFERGERLFERQGRRRLSRPRQAGHQRRDRNEE